MSENPEIKERAAPNYKKYLLTLSLIINIVFLILLVYFLGSIYRNEKEFFCRDVAHEAVFRELIRNTTITDNSYTESYYYAYDNCVQYRKNN